MSKSEAILRVKLLKRYFKSRSAITKAVDGVDLKLLPGEVVGLIGESGSGKTTIGRNLVRLYDEFSGTIELFGRNLPSKRLSRKNARFLRDKVQMIFQDPTSSLNSQHTIYSILREPLVVNRTIATKIDDLMLFWPEVVKRGFFRLKTTYLKKLTSLLAVFNKESGSFFLRLEQSLETVTNELREYLAIFDDPEKAIARSTERLKIWSEEEMSVLTKIIKEANANYNELVSGLKEQVKGLSKHDKTTKERDFLAAKSDLKEKKDSFFYGERLLTIKQKRQQLLVELKQIRSEVNFIFEQRRGYFRQMLEGFKLEIEALKLEISNTRNHLEFKVKTRFLLIYNNLSKHFKTKKKRFYSLNIQSQTSLERESLELVKELQEEVLKDPDLAREQLKEKLATRIKDLKLDELVELSLKEEETLLAKIAKKRAEVDTKNYILARFCSLKKPLLSLSDKNKRETLKASWTKFKETKKTLQEQQRKEELEEVKLFKEVLTNYKKIKLQFRQSNRLLRRSLVDFKRKLISLYQPLFKTVDRKKREQNRERFNNLRQKLTEDINKFSDIIKEFKHNLKEISRVGWLYANRMRPALLTLLKPLASRAARRIILDETIYKTLADVGLLRQFAYRYPHEFSGGQRQRVAIARAIISEPKIIVADEPISALDISIQAQIINLLRSLCSERGIGIIFIAHDLGIVENIADWILIMHSGKIVEEGETKKVFKDPIHPYTRNLLDKVPRISNAAQPFKPNPFISYKRDHDPLNPVVRLEVDKDHFVLGTKDQIDQWTKEARSKRV